MAFVDIPITIDPTGIEQDTFDRIAGAFPGWEPADGNLETWLVRALAELAADLAGVSTEVPSAIFAEFGRRIVGVPQNEPAPALALATWTAVDNAGYTIPEGTQFGVQIAGDEIVAFAVDADAAIPPGSTSLPGVSAHAVIAGESGNGLSGAAVPIDALSFVSSIALDSATAGGIDGESDDVYLGRLADEMTLLAPRPILPADAEILARRQGEVARALALDGWDPDTDTSGNERMTAIALIDADGEEVSSATQTAVLDQLEALRELNFVFKIEHPTYTTINIDVQAMALPGFAPDVVQAAVEARLTAYLEPSAWGSSLLSPSSALWRQVSTLRQGDLIAQVKTVQGLDYVEHLYMAISPTSPSSGADVALPGAAPLTRPGTINATIDAP